MYRLTFSEEKLSVMIKCLVFFFKEHSYIKFVQSDFHNTGYIPHK